MRHATSLALLLSAACLACGPLGPFPGGRLRGERAATPDSWSLADDVTTVQLETRPDDPYSINVWIGVYQGSLYVPTSLIFGPDNPEERSWVRNLNDDPRVRLRIDDEVYSLRAVRVSDPDELAGARARLLAKCDVEADEHARSGWIFRLDPR